MDFKLQTSLIILVFLLISLLINLLFKRFKQGMYLSMFPAIPLALFCLGFIFRLSDNKPLIDLGFFFTELAFLTTYLLFAISLLLGQIKYWRKIP